MAFLNPHFDPDIFVSYSHGAPRRTGNAPLKTWTQAFVEKLLSEIHSLRTDLDDLDIWFDRHLDPTAHLTDALRGKASASGILLIVMSAHYLGSSWCRDELEWFHRQIKDRVGDVGRVFVVRIQDTDAKAWPAFLRDERDNPMPGFAFFDPLDGDYPYGWPDCTDCGPIFRKEFCRLQTALVKRLRELRDRAARRAQAEAAAPIQPQLGRRRIYLHASTAADPLRAEIDGALTQDGIVSMTAPASSGGGMAAWQKDGRLRMEMAKRCEALALLRADDDGERFTADVFDIGVDERDRIVSARGGPLPCAVLDRSGAGRPPGLDQLDIEHFDVTRDGWRGTFKSWLDANRAATAGAQP